MILLTSENENNLEFYESLYDNFPIPIIVLEISSNLMKFRRFNKEFENFNKKFAVFIDDDIKEGDIRKLSEKDFEKSSQMRKGDFSLLMLKDVLSKEIGSQNVFKFKIHKRINPSEILDEKHSLKKSKKTSKKSSKKSKKKVEDDSNQFVNVTITKISKNLVMMMYEYVKENDAKDSYSLNFENFSFLNINNYPAFTIKNNIITASNQNFMKILDYSKKNNIIGRRIEEFVYSSDLHDFLNFINNLNSEIDKKAPEHSARFIKKGGELEWLKLSPIMYKIRENEEPEMIFSVLDITEEKKTELMLLQTHRLVSIGELTGGIAHEINNPLFGIMNYATLIKDTIDNDIHITKTSEEYEYLLGITKEAERISQIIRNLSEFSGKAEDKQFVPTNLPEVVEKVEELLSYQLRHSHIKFEKDFVDNLPLIMLQRFRIEHVLFNLILNSIQALYALPTREHKIKISMRIEKNVNNIKQDDTFSSDILKIKVYDNGEGIPDENLLKIFDPFFTTRRASHSRGLGLHTTYNIINEHHGKITVDSDIGEWTEFLIEIPVKYPKEAF